MVLDNKIIVDFTKPVNKIHWLGQQYDDNSRKLIFELHNNGHTLTIPQTSTVLFRFIKPDNTEVSLGCVIEDATNGIVSVILDDNMSYVEGIGELQIVISYKGSMLYSIVLKVRIGKSIDEDGFLPSDDESPFNKVVEALDTKITEHIEDTVLTDDGVHGIRLNSHKEIEAYVDNTWINVSDGIEVTKEEYKNLPDSEKHSGAVYFVTDEVLYQSVSAGNGDTGAGASGSIPVDTYLSSTSTHPVQNKIITNKINEHNNSNINSSSGIHGIRYSNGVLSVKYDGMWHDLLAGSEIKLSQAEYDRLSEEEKMNGNTYFVYDAN